MERTAATHRHKLDVSVRAPLAGLEDRGDAAPGVLSAAGLRDHRRAVILAGGHQRVPRLLRQATDALSEEEEQLAVGSLTGPKMEQSQEAPRRRTRTGTIPV